MFELNTDVLEVPIDMSTLIRSTKIEHQFKSKFINFEVIEESKILLANPENVVVYDLLQSQGIVLHEFENSFMVSLKWF